MPAPTGVKVEQPDGPVGGERGQPAGGFPPDQKERVDAAAAQRRDRLVDAQLLAVRSRCGDSPAAASSPLAATITWESVAPTETRRPRSSVSRVIGESAGTTTCSASS